MDKLEVDAAPAHDARLEVYLDAQRIADRVGELARSIDAAYEGQTVTCIGVLKGSVIFLADLLRGLRSPTTVEFLGVSSYQGTESTGAVQITHDLRSDIGGRHCLIVEDIVDTGLTLDYLLRILKARSPASLRVATLLDKPSRRLRDVDVDFVGFSIPDHFVVGYGLDLDEGFRHLPHIAIYRG